MRVFGRMVRGVCLLLLLAGGCMRYETSWSGVQIADGGERFLVAAEPGLCDCVTFINKSRATVHLLARKAEEDLGRATLSPGQRMMVRFDWAGDAADEFYVIEAVGADGQPIPIAKFIEVRDNPRSHPCAGPGCSWAPLNMNLMTKVQQ